MRSMLPGVGVFGNTPAMRCYIPILKSCGLEVVALWARTNEEAKQMSEELGIPIYTTSVDKVLLDKHVDLVVISCSPHIQAHIAAKALGIGKHVLCSPPSGPRSRDTLPMVHASRYYPRLMSLMCNGLRFLPSVVKMRRLVRETGFIGEVTVCEVNVRYCCSGILGHKGAPRVGHNTGTALTSNTRSDGKASGCGSTNSHNTTAYDWTCDETMGGGVLNMYGGMVVDLLTHVTGLKASRVQGLVRTYVRQTEKVSGIREITSDDFCCFQMELGANGACATVTLNSQVPGPFSQEITVVGTLGRLTLRGSDLYGQKHDRAKEDLLHFDPSSLKDMEAFGISLKNDEQHPHHHDESTSNPITSTGVNNNSTTSNHPLSSSSTSSTTANLKNLHISTSSSSFSSSQSSPSSSISPVNTSSLLTKTSISPLNTSSTKTTATTTYSSIYQTMPAPYLKGVAQLLASLRDAFQQVEEKQGWCPEPLSPAATFEDCFYVQTVLDAVRTASRTRQSVKIVLADTEPEPNRFLSTAMRRSTFSLH